MGAALGQMASTGIQSSIANSPILNFAKQLTTDPAGAGQSASNPFSGAASVAPAASGDNPIQTASLNANAPYRDPQVSAPNASVPTAPGGAPTSSGPNSGRTGNSRAEMESYIVEQAKANGIDPQAALKVARSEGLAVTDPDKGKNGAGDGNSSFGPFQLHYGGINPAMPHPGMGDDFTKATGLDARDPKTWKQQVQFALGHAANNGWGAWMGAKNSGMGNWDGIKGAMPGSANSQMAHQTPGSPDDLLRQHSAALAQQGFAYDPAAVGAAPAAAPGAGDAAAQKLSAFKHVGQPQLGDNTPKPMQDTPAADLGAQQVAQTQESLRARAGAGTQNQQQRKAQLEARVHNKKAGV